MIDVKIVENNGLVALCSISGSNDEFNNDLVRLKTIPYIYREFVLGSEPKYWRISNPEEYADQVVEIGDAIKLHKMQTRMDL